MSHSRASTNPTGGDGSRRDLAKPALHEALMVRVLDSANMRRAWKRVKANKGAPGVDGMGIEDFKHNVRRLTGCSWGVSMGYRLHKLAQYVRGWMGYFGISDYYRPIPELDSWLRRRIRMCYWKQWCRTRTKVCNLPALGTSKRHAILTALSSKSYWHLSRTLATKSGITHEWLKSQGLIDIRTMLMKAHGYA